jgi:hypothetical protein
MQQGKNMCRNTSDAGVMPALIYPAQPQPQIPADCLRIKF